MQTKTQHVGITQRFPLKKGKLLIWIKMLIHMQTQMSKGVS